MTARRKPKADKAQRQRFIKAAREAGASEDERAFDESLRRLATTKPKPAKKSSGGG